MPASAPKIGKMDDKSGEESDLGQLESAEILDAGDDTSGADFSHEVIEPPAVLADKVRYKNYAKGTATLVKNAEDQVANYQFEFANWFRADLEALRTTWDAAKADNQDPVKLVAFLKAVQTIKGAASMLGFPRAGDIANPLGTLMERMIDVVEHVEIVDLTVASICLCGPDSDVKKETLEEMQRGLYVVIAKKIARMN